MVGNIRTVPLMIVVMFMALVCLPVAQASAQNNDLITVKVTINIENPRYFWQYPFWGRQLDNIRVSGMGKTVMIPAQTSAQTVEFEVPKGYTLRVWLQFPSEISDYKEVCYEKRNINEKNNALNITLKAPDTQAVIVNSSDFDEKKTKNW